MLIWSGLFIFGYLGWLLWGTDLVNAGVQSAASDELTVEIAQTDPQVETVEPDDVLGSSLPEFPDPVDYYPEEAVAEGEPFAFLTIPSIGLDRVVVYEGVSRDDLKKGPGHMGSTALPGQPGNAVISGHRTTHGRPFFDFDLLEIGDRVEVETSVGTHVYEIREIQVVQPTDVWVTNPRPGGWLTMTTCNPKFSARERLVVWAEMVGGPNLEYIQLDKAKFEQT
jgi:sortase A